MSDQREKTQPLDLSELEGITADGPAPEVDERPAPRAPRAAAAPPTAEELAAKQLAAIFAEIERANPPEGRWWAKRLADPAREVTEGLCPHAFTGTPSVEAIVAAAGGDGRFMFTPFDPFGPPPPKGVKQWYGPIPILGPRKALPTVEAASRVATAAAAAIAPPAPPPTKVKVYIQELRRHVDMDEGEFRVFQAEQEARQRDAEAAKKPDPVLETLRAMQTTQAALLREIAEIKKAAAAPPKPAEGELSPTALLKNMLDESRTRNEALVAELRAERDAAREDRRTLAVAAPAQPPVDLFTSAAHALLLDKLKGASDEAKAAAAADATPPLWVTLLEKSVGGAMEKIEKAVGVAWGDKGDPGPARRLAEVAVKRAERELEGNGGGAPLDPNPPPKELPPLAAGAPPASAPANPPPDPDEARRRAISMAIDEMLAALDGAIRGDEPIDTAAKSIRRAIPNLGPLEDRVKNLRTGRDLKELLEKLAGPWGKLGGIPQAYQKRCAAIAAACADEAGMANADAVVAALSG